jgi:aarF domain-containing kinase
MSTTRSRGGNRSLSLLRTLGSTALRATGEAVLKKLSGQNADTKGPHEGHVAPLGFLSSAAAERLVRGLDELKGAAMKVGQMLSMEQDILPLAWQNALATLQSKSTPRPFHEIEPLLRQSLGSLDAFRWIDPHAVHAASMAQVHVGELDGTGEKVAIKIRYPNLREHVESDLRSLQRIFKLAGLVQREEEWQRILHKVRDVFLQELDFHEELKRTKRFAEQLAGETDIITARPIESLCREDVLVTTWLDGLGLDAWMTSQPRPSQKERSRMGTLLVRCILLEIFQYRHLQSDPNPANFLVLADGRLGLVDFGASVDLPSSLIEPYRAMAIASLDDHREGVLAAAKTIGFLHPTDSPEAEDCFARLMSMTSEPFRQESFFWGDQRLSEGIKKESLRFAQLTRLRVPPEDLIFLNRRILGTQLSLEKMAPTVKARALFEEIVRG